MAAANAHGMLSSLRLARSSSRRFSSLYVQCSAATAERPPKASKGSSDKDKRITPKSTDFSRYWCLARQTKLQATSLRRLWVSNATLEQVVPGCGEGCGAGRLWPGAGHHGHQALRLCHLGRHTGAHAALISSNVHSMALWALSLPS